MGLFPVIFCKMRPRTEKVEIRNMNFAGCRSKRSLKKVKSEKCKAGKTNSCVCREKQGMKCLEATVVTFRD